jgi:hypothetical protein
MYVGLVQVFPQKRGVASATTSKLESSASCATSLPQFFFLSHEIKKMYKLNDQCFEE